MTAEGRRAGELVPQRSTRLGVALVTRGVVLTRGEETLLLESEAPEGKAAWVRDLFDAWVGQIDPVDERFSRGGAPGPT